MNDMGAYIACFIASLALLKFSEHIKRGQRYFFIIVALSIPCFLASFRADTIGTDVNVYLVPMYNSAKNSQSFFEYLSHGWFHIYKYNYVRDYEILFTCLVYITTKVFHSIVAVKFLIQALIIAPIYIAWKRYFSHVSLCVVFLTYFCMIYNQSFNLMRQYIAIAFLILGIVGYWKNENIKTYVIYQVIAILFHSSAIIGIVVFLICKYLRVVESSKLNQDNVKRRVITASLLGIVALIGFEIFGQVLNIFGLGRYLGYVSSGLTFMPNQIIIRLPIILLCIITWNKTDLFKNNNWFGIEMLIYTLIFSQLAGSSTFGARIVVYFAFYQIFLIAELYSKNHNLYVGFGNIILGVNKILILGYLMFYWWYFFSFLQMDATVPYLLG